MLDFSPLEAQNSELVQRPCARGKATLYKPGKISVLSKAALVQCDAGGTPTYPDALFLARRAL